MSTLRTIQTLSHSGSGLQNAEEVNVAFPDGVSTSRSFAVVGVLSESVPVSAFTDGGSTTGTYVMAGAVPAGSVILGTKFVVTAGFAGDVSATMTVGDGSDVDRYHTGTPSVFTTTAVGVESGIPSGTKLLTSANNPTLTVTSSTDFTLVKTNASGIVVVNIYFLQTA